MDFSHFVALGDDLQSRFRRLNHDELAFSKLAAEVLTGYHQPFEWNPEAIARFLTSTTVAQDPNFEFSNLPVIVYRCPEFYIELLVWTSGTTSIHQHSFSGAFKVLTGSSLHSRYSFREERRINHRLQLGKVHCQQVEYLQQGDIREIHPGAGGLSHSLFHLDHPSVTLVIRTLGMQAYLPQMTLFPPGIAYSEPDWDMDLRNKMFQRLLDTAGDIEKDSFNSLLLGEIPRLDFASVFYLAHENRGLLLSGNHRDDFFAAVSKQHGPELADTLSLVIHEAWRVDSLRAARRGTRDGDVRFFLALLMNIHQRRPILEILRLRFPGEDPVIKCANLLARLCEQRQEAGRLMAKMAASASMSDYKLGARIAGVLPVGLSSLEMTNQLAGILGRTEGDAASSARTQLAAINELKPLFITA